MIASMLRVPPNRALWAVVAVCALLPLAALSLRAAAVAAIVLALGLLARIVAELLH